MGENARFKKRTRACRNTRFKKASVSKKCRRPIQALVDSVSVRFKNARVEKVRLNIRTQWNVGTACVSECVLKTLACRGWRVGPSKIIRKGQACKAEGVGDSDTHRAGKSET